MDEDRLSYGTHTLPQKFWTSGKPGLLKDPAYRERREAKRVRHYQNQLAKAEANRKK